MTLPNAINPTIDSNAQTGDCDGGRRDALVEVVRYVLLSAVFTAGGSRQVWALSIGDLSQGDASAGVKTALERGANFAVELLGKENGFWGNDKVRIPLPDWIEKAERAIKFMGRGKDVDDLKIGVNRAAESAVPQAKTLLVRAVKGMSVTDAKSILTGGDNSVTHFFQERTQVPLNEKFLPIVTQVTNKIGLATQYNALAAQVQKTGFVKLKPEQTRVETHVTSKALDGLFYMIGEEKKKNSHRSGRYRQRYFEEGVWGGAVRGVRHNLACALHSPLAGGAFRKQPARDYFSVACCIRSSKDMPTYMRP